MTEPDQWKATAGNRAADRPSSSSSSLLLLLSLASFLTNGRKTATKLRARSRGWFKAPGRRRKGSWFTENQVQGTISLTADGLGMKMLLLEERAARQSPAAGWEGSLGRNPLLHSSSLLPTFLILIKSCLSPGLCPIPPSLLRFPAPSISVMLASLAAFIFLRLPAFEDRLADRCVRRKASDKPGLPLICHPDRLDVRASTSRQSRRGE